MDEQRSRETRARAETALVRLLHALGDDDVFLVVLGGLAPAVLASNEAFVPEHLGTTDVDVLLITHVDLDADLGAVERALEQLDFKPDPSEDGWRWRGPIEGVPVKLEFLCDLPDTARARSSGRTAAERSAPRTFAAPAMWPATSPGRN